jgi:hypothetical protein
MAKKKIFVGMLVVVLAFGMSAVSCGGDDDDDKWSPDELLRKYIGSEPQTWDDNVVVQVYFLDPSKFDACKAEIDALDGLSVVDEDEETRDWDIGISMVRWAVNTDGEEGNFQLARMKNDNSTFFYAYKTTLPDNAEPAALKGILGKYMGAVQQIWDDDEKVYVYYFDPSSFEDFRAELEATGKVSQTDYWTYTRDWDMGKEFARWAVRADGSLQLELCEASNSSIVYMYKKVN